MQYRGEMGGMKKGEMVAAGTPQIPQKWSFIHYWGFQPQKKREFQKRVNSKKQYTAPTYYPWRRLPLFEFEFTDEESNVLSMSSENF